MNHYESIRKVKSFYHASPRYFQPGTLLDERLKNVRNFPASGPWVYLTDSPAVHQTIWERAKREN